MKAEIKAPLSSAASSSGTPSILTRTDAAGPDGSAKSALDVAVFDRSGVGFTAALQAAQTTTVGLATTYTGLCVSNPKASTVNLVITRASFGFAAAPAAVCVAALMFGFSSSTDVTHTAALTAAGLQTNLMNFGAAGSAKADTSATLTGTPAYGPVLFGGFTAGALPAPSQGLFDHRGLFVLPPGAWVAIATSSVASIFGSISWLEQTIIV